MWFALAASLAVLLVMLIDAGPAMGMMIGLSAGFIAGVLSEA